jgi:hypothetical protein
LICKFVNHAAKMRRAQAKIIYFLLVIKIFIRYI